jgi:hypothetical protein
VFLISDAWSGSMAADFVRRSGGTFGFAGNDADNGAGENALIESGLVMSEPWIGVIRASDMQLIRHDGDGSYLDLAGIARSLAQE